MLADKLLDLLDLPENNFYIEINKKLSAKLSDLISQQYKSYYGASRALNLPSGSFYGWRKKRKYPLCILKQFITANLLTLTALKKNIVSISSGVYPAKGNGTGNLSTSIYPKFPINLSKEFVRIIAHAFGDGCIYKDKQGYFTFQYYNQDAQLRDLFKEDISIVFNPIKISEGINKTTPYVALPTPIAQILLQLIETFDSKKCTVPIFIKSANKEIKAEFIKAFLDDEAHVCFRPPHRYIELALSNRTFLEELRELLEEFGIKTKIYKKIFRNKFNIYYFYIRGYSNIKKFKDAIGFDHSLKQEKLKQILKYPGRESFARGETRERIINLLKDKEQATSKEIAQYLGRKQITAVTFLIRLRKEGKVGYIKEGKKYIWRLIK